MRPGTKPPPQRIANTCRTQMMGATARPRDAGIKSSRRPCASFTLVLTNHIQPVVAAPKTAHTGGGKAALCASPPSSDAATGRQGRPPARRRCAARAARVCAWTAWRRRRGGPPVRRSSGPRPGGARPAGASAPDRGRRGGRADLALRRAGLAGVAGGLPRRATRGPAARRRGGPPWSRGALRAAGSLRRARGRGAAAEARRRRTVGAAPTRAVEPLARGGSAVAPPARASSCGLRRARGRGCVCVCVRARARVRACACCPVSRHSNRP